MKKIIFVDIPLYKKDCLNYHGTGNVKSKYDKPVLYPINAFLLDELKDNDELKIVLLKTKTGKELEDEQTKQNARCYEDELDSILKQLSAGKIDGYRAVKNVKVDYVPLVSDFDESKENHEIRFKNMLNYLEEDCDVYADITFGPRLIPMMILYVFNFAERFFNCKIRGILYGKALFDEKNKAHSGEMFDVSPMYYLNNLVNSMEAPDGKAAIKALDTFFSL